MGINSKIVVVIKVLKVIKSKFQKAQRTKNKKSFSKTKKVKYQIFMKVHYACKWEQLETIEQVENWNDDFNV